MNVKELFTGTYQIVAIVDGEHCPAEDFLYEGEDSTQAYREGLITMLNHTAGHGLSSLPSAWTHEASKKDKIYEYIKGPLRLFFFKGKGRQIVICTVGTRKSGMKANKTSVTYSNNYRKEYDIACDNNTLRIIDNDN